MQLWKPSYNDQNQNDHPHQHWGVHVAFPLKLFHIEAENSFVSLRKSQSYSITIIIFPPIQNHHLPHLLLQNSHVLVTELPLLSPKQFNSKVLNSCYLLLLICFFSSKKWCLNRTSTSAARTARCASFWPSQEPQSHFFLSPEDSETKLNHIIWATFCCKSCCGKR